MNSALGGLGEEQRMHGAQSQLNVADCGILDKSLPSQDPQDTPMQEALETDHPGTALFPALL